MTTSAAELARRLADKPTYDDGAYVMVSRQERSDIIAALTRLETAYDRGRAVGREAEARYREALELMLSHGERCNWFADRGDEEVCEIARAALQGDTAKGER